MSNVFQGNPCRKGHDGTRYSKNSKCVECTRLANQSYSRDKKNASTKAWRLANPDRHKQNVLTWRANNRERELLAGAKRRAADKNLPFDLVLDDIVIPDTCPVFGIPMTTPSLDRIKPHLGYVKGNVCVISLEANRMKQDATIEQLEQIIAYMKKEGDYQGVGSGKQPSPLSPYWQSPS